MTVNRVKLLDLSMAEKSDRNSKTYNTACFLVAEKQYTLRT